MDVVEKLVAATTEELPITKTNNFETKSTVKGCQVYKDIWVPKIGGKCFTEIEPDNPGDKYAVCTNDRIIEHMSLGKFGNFAKTIFYFLKHTNTVSVKL